MSRFAPPPDEFSKTHIRRFALMLAGGGLILFLGFFSIFASNLPTTPDDVPPAGGIVVFTGTATTRITTSLALLNAGKGERLLVSGVYDNQSFETIIGLAAEDSPRIRCCVDLDYRARNTFDNNRQTAIWAEIHGYDSLILVTSAHHLPRAFLELRRAMPKVKLSAYPVVPQGVKLDRWWRYPGTTSLLLGEYIRYLWVLTGLPRGF